MSLLKSRRYLSCHALWPLVVFAIGMRLLPHPANVTPCLAFALLGAQYFRRRDVWLSLLALLVATDMGLAITYGHQMFGSWTLFTYSAMMAVAYVSSSFRRGFGLQCVCLVSASVGFWCWSNLGVWLFSGMYAHTISGLLVTYTKALPFLRNQMLGDLAWFGCMHVYLVWAYQRAQRSSVGRHAMRVGG